MPGGNPTQWRAGEMMFDLNTGWKNRMAGAVLPASSAKPGWSVAQTAEPGFVEPALRIAEGSPLTAKAIVVAAPGAVGKSVFARTLGSLTSCAVVDLARTEQLGGNFFVGGIANAFGIAAVTDASEGRLGLVVDALDEGQLRAGAEGFSVGLSDLAQIVRQPRALPVTLFGRSAAAEEAWLILNDLGVQPCLLEMEFFDEDRARLYIERKLPVIAARRPESERAYDRHRQAFLDLAITTRAKLKDTPDGHDPRFAGYAPVLDAVCSYAIEDGLNPQARIAELLAKGPVGLIAEISAAILRREQGKLVEQLRQEVRLEGVDLSSIYSPEEQLGRLATALIGAPAPASPEFDDENVRRAYERMVADFAPQHPFVESGSKPSNAAFAAYLLVWAMASRVAADEARRALTAQPALASGLVFDLYMLWLKGEAKGHFSDDNRRLVLADVGPLHSAFGSQAGQRQVACLEITGESGDPVVEVAFDMETLAEGDVPARHYGPFEAQTEGVLELRGPLSNLTINAPIAVVVGDGKAINITAPVEIVVELLEIDGREVRVFKSAATGADEAHQVFLSAEAAVTGLVEKLTVLGGRLAVSFPNANQHPWERYSVEAPAAPNPEIEILRRRLRRVLTAFRSHSKGALVRLTAKIDHARMMKRDDLGPQLVERLKTDGILTMFEAGKFYMLHPDKMAAALNMDYQALQHQRWSAKADEYLSALL